MTVINIVALSVLAAAVLVHALAICVYYVPRMRCQLFHRLRMVRHVRMVARIRDFNNSPEVKQACTVLLQTLIR